MSTTFKKIITKYKVWLICAIAIIVIPMLNPNFLSTANIQSIIRQMIPYGTIAVGLTLGYISGIINLTIGSAAALSAGIFVQLTGIIGLLPSFLITMLTGAVIGLIAAFLVCKLGLHNWLVVISMMIAMKGLAVVVCEYTSIPIRNATFEVIANAQVGPISALFFLYLAIVFGAEWFLRNTKFGREMYAVGGDAQIAQACGINVLRIKTITFVISSMLSALGGVLLVTRLFSANGTLGTNTIMEVLPMSIIGGASFAGGKGSAIGTLSGTLSMVLISSTMNLFNLDPNMQSIVQGVILILIIASDKFVINREKKV